jgi:hypothetical protein
MNEKNIGCILYKVTDYAFSGWAAIASIKRADEF